MDKFWEWMGKENCVRYSEALDNYYLKGKGYDAVIPTKRMLIGYMIEYLCGKSYFDILKKLPMVYHGIDKIYDNLVEQINKLEVMKCKKCNNKMGFI